MHRKQITKVKTEVAPNRGIKRNAGMVITGKKELAEINLPKAQYIEGSSLCDPW